MNRFGNILGGFAPLLQALAAEVGPPPLRIVYTCTRAPSLPLPPEPTRSSLAHFKVMPRH